MSTMYKRIVRRAFVDIVYKIQKKGKNKVFYQSVENEKF